MLNITFTFSPWVIPILVFYIYTHLCLVLMSTVLPKIKQHSADIPLLNLVMDWYYAAERRLYPGNIRMRGAAGPPPGAAQKNNAKSSTLAATAQCLIWVCVCDADGWSSRPMSLYFCIINAAGPLLFHVIAFLAAERCVYYILICNVVFFIYLFNKTARRNFAQTTLALRVFHLFIYYVHWFPREPWGAGRWIKGLPASAYTGIMKCGDRARGFWSNNLHFLQNQWCTEKHVTERWETNVLHSGIFFVPRVWLQRVPFLFTIIAGLSFGLCEVIREIIKNISMKMKNNALSIFMNYWVK